MRDVRVRLAVFRWLEKEVARHGGDGILPRRVLAAGFDFQGDRVPIVGPQGIFKPRIMELPLSITTSPNSPYHDGFTEDERLHYRYRGTDPNHPDNMGLVRAMKTRSPLVYCHGLMPGRYLVAWPVYVEHADPRTLTFTVAVDDPKHAMQADPDLMMVAQAPGGLMERSLNREYATREVRRRIHQSRFRERVLAAYRNQCAFCRLRHEQLLDAAHIIPDGEKGGEPEVWNGMALCKLHHAAFDQFFIGVTPRGIIEVRRDIMDEEDGPMLLHGLQGMDGRKIFLPTERGHRPAPASLEWRYEQFRAAR